MYRLMSVGLINLQIAAVSKKRQLHLCSESVQFHVKVDLIIKTGSQLSGSITTWSNETFNSLARAALNTNNKDDFK